MEEGGFWYWLGLLGLGAFHGINPGMGWLFAVALGMQERNRVAVWKALAPLTAGHLLAVGAAVFVALAAGQALSGGILKTGVGLWLVGLGLWRLKGHRHRTGGGMRVSPAGLTSWSFLMASGHGAGLMVLPLFLGFTAPAGAATCHGESAGGATLAGLAATLAHGAGYFAVMALTAWLVFEKLGVGLLRKAWVNLDLIWAAALITTGAATFVL